MAQNFVTSKKMSNFATSKTRHLLGLTQRLSNGVMVARRILVPPVRVRVLLGQHHNQFKALQINDLWCFAYIIT